MISFRGTRGCVHTSVASFSSSKMFAPVFGTETTIQYYKKGLGTTAMQEN